MPCRDYEDTPQYQVEQNQQNRSEIKRQKEKLDMLSRIACKALSTLEQIQVAHHVGTVYREVVDTVLNDNEVLFWWPEHKRLDAEEQDKLRAKEQKRADNLEKARKKAVLLSRLTQEEKDLLGLK